MRVRHLTFLLFLMVIVVGRPLAQVGGAESDRPEPTARGPTGRVQDSEAITLFLRNATLASVLAEIDKQSKLRIIYGDDVLGYPAPITVSIAGASLASALSAALQGANLTARFASEHVVLIVPSQDDGPRTGVVHGVVRDERTGRPIAGATVQTGEGVSVVADSSGAFTLEGIQQGRRRLYATGLGYDGRLTEVSVTGGQTIRTSILLEPRIVHLDEIVAIGYGAARRRDLTGSIMSLKLAELPPEGASRISVPTSLLGRVAGVQVVSYSGAPGASPILQIRGTQSIAASNEPLYVIDGLPVSAISTPLNSIDPVNIESIEILKDASATAIYGSRGANGVVLITTRRGANVRSSIVLETSYGIQRPTRFIPVLSGPEYMRLVNEGLVNGGAQPRYTEAQIATAATFDYPRALMQNLEWQPQQSHSITISGGDAGTRYLVSGNYTEQKGIVLNSGFNRFGARVNLDRAVSQRFRIGASLSGTRTYQEDNGAEDTSTGSGSVGITTAMQYDPTVPPVDPVTGVRNTTIQLVSDFMNPITEAEGRDNPEFVTGLLTTFFGEYDVANGVVLRSTIGGNFRFEREYSYSPSWIASGSPDGVASQSSDEGRELTNENMLTLRRDIGPGSLDAVLGASIQTSRAANFTAQARGFPVDQLSFNNLAAGSQLVAPSSNVTEWVLLSQLGRINYNLMEKYLFTVTARRDGSSRFGANNKYALFPSAAFAWRVVDEGFMQNQNLFSDLKLRLSYGRTGNQAITEYQSLARMQTAYTAFGTNTPVVTLVPAAAAPNRDLKWETQDQFNAGLDLAFLDNRVTLTADAYQSNTSNLLLMRQLPQHSGYTSQLQNVGAVRNRGLETSLRTVNLEGDNLTWETTLNLSMNRNRVTQLYGGLQALAVGSSTQVGEPLNTFVGFKVLGLYQQGDACDLIATAECAPGEYRILDANGDRVINDNDRVNLGSPEPDFYGGFSNSLRIGPLSLDAFFSFSMGNEINNSAMRWMGLVAGATNERADLAAKRWTPANTKTTVPRANSLRPSNRTYSTYVEDGSFLRLQTITLSCELPSTWIRGTEDFRVILMGQNPWITTRYSGWDPQNEPNDAGGYPRAHTFNLAVSLTF